MSLWDNTPVTYTSFTPLTSDSQSSNSLFSRFFKRGKDDSDQSSDAGSIPSSREVSVERTGGSRASVDRKLKLEDAGSHDQSGNQGGSPIKTARKASFSKLSEKQSGAGNSDEQSDQSTSKSSETDQSESQDTTKRTFSSVITRLSTILERRAPVPQVYRDSDFKQYWMPDSSCKECYDCGDQFTTFRRRHHCRICGQIFCKGCCDRELSGKIIGYKGSIRVCTYCDQIVNNYAQKASPLGDPKVTKESLDKCLQSAELLSPEHAVKKKSILDLNSSLNLRSPSESDTSLVLAAPFDLTPQSEFVADNFTSERRLLIQDSMQLRSLWSLVLDAENGVEFQSYRFRLRTYPKCIAGNRLVDWLLKQDKVANRIQAVAIGQALIDADYLDPVLNVTTPFRDDFTLYKPTDMTVMDSTLPILDLEDSISEDSAPQWFQEIQENTRDSGHVNEGNENVESSMITSNSHSDLSQDSTGIIRVDDTHFANHIPRTDITEDITESLFGEVPEVLEANEDQVTTASWRTLSIATDNTEEKTIFNQIQQEHHEHLTILTKQLLSEEGLTAAWVDIIISTVDRVSLFVKPDVRISSDDADIRRYVHIKKVPGDKRGQTCLVHGVIFNKNIAHKKMTDNIQNPGVLLLEGTIEYQRVENKMSSLQPQILQEEEFLRKTVAKIAALKPKPDVLVVEKSVSRLAQDYLLKHGITLIYNVKRSVMERLSRFLQTIIATSVDSLMRGPSNQQMLGFCHTFSVRSYKLPSGDAKNMICFDGCATHLGCAIILRGGPLAELKRVKKIMSFMIYASYHSRLETAFCMDEFLKPISMSDSLMDFTLDIKQDDLDIDYKGYHDVDRKAKLDAGGVNVKKDKSDDVVNDGNVNIAISGEEEKCFETLKPANSANMNFVQDVKDGVAVTKDSDVTDVQCVDEMKGVSDAIDVKRTDGVKSVPDDSDEVVSKESLKFESQKEERTSTFIRCDTIEENEDEVEEYQSETKGDTVDQSNSMSSVVNQSDSKSGVVDQSDSKDVFVDQSKSVCDNQSKHDISEKHLEGTDHEKGKSMLERKSKDCEIENHDLERKGKDLEKDKSEGWTETKTANLRLEDVASDATSCNPISSSDQTVSETLPNKSINIESSPVLLRRQEHRRMSELPSGHKTERHSFQRRQSEVIQLTDHSDPLHNYQKSQDESIFQSSIAFQEERHSNSFEPFPKLKEFADNYQENLDESIFKSSIAFQEEMHSNRFKLKKCLENVVLSVSPYIKYDLPYLETEAGSKCELRPYFPEEIYWSSHYGTKNGQTKSRFKYLDEKGKKYDPPSHIQITEAHDFIRCQLNKPACDKDTLYMLAKYRAYGGRINVVNSKGSKSKQNENQSTKGRQLSGENTLKGDNPQRESGVLWEKKVDSLDPFRHQRLAVLFSSFSYESENHPNPCVYPWVVTMDFYGKNDITLGGFLERFCFRQSYVCPSDACNTPMEKHIRRFVHGQGSVSVVLKKVSKPLKDGQTNILLWSWCHKCKQVTPVLPLSSESWHMSFAKYLEFRFHGSSYKCRTSVDPCSHSLHHDHFQYFGFDDMVASFKYSTIKLKEIKLPPFVICKLFRLEVIELYRIRDEVKRLTMKITEQFSSILDFMTRMKAETNCENLIRLINDSNTHQQNERTSMREVAHTIRDKVNILLTFSEDKKIMDLNHEQKQIYFEIEDDVIRLKRKMAEAVLTWNSKLQDLYMQQRKSKQTSGQKKEREKDTISVNSTVTLDTEDKELKSASSSMLMSIDVDTPSSSLISMSGESASSSMLMSMDVDTPANSLLSMSGEIIQPPGPEHRHQRQISDVSIPPPSPNVLSSLPGSTDGSLDTPDEKSDLLDATTHGRTSGNSLNDEEVDKTLQSTVEPVAAEKLVIPEALPARKSPAEDQGDGSTGDKIGALKKTLMNTIWQGSGAFQLTMPFDPCEHYLLPPCLRLPVVVYDHEPSSIISYSLSCSDYQAKLHELQTTLIQSQKHARQEQDFTDRSIKEEGSPARKSNPGKLSFFKGGGKDRQEQPDVVRYVPRPDSGHLESPLDEADYSLFTGSTNESMDKSKSIKQAVNSHIELQFSDSTARFYCKIYFAEQFRQLRKLIFPEGEDGQAQHELGVCWPSLWNRDFDIHMENMVGCIRSLAKDRRFIRSLCRCKPWEAKGGKSGSSFCKTDDDRFILKQMSGMEVESFEKFGPKYFQYISKTEKQQRPSALAKIVGVYRIGFRNQQTNNAMKQDLIVLENLFYNRTISQTFDLKGSERNRLVKTTRKADEELVLLDENFLRVSVDCPLYMLPHSKTMLMMAIGHDSQFLSSNLVMDYSLLVGVDDQRKELVVGIIDYIRTFTWDKKLETILKSNFGGQGKMPTVVSPEVYRTRFLDAMGKYFLSVPDQWSGLGKDVDI